MNCYLAGAFIMYILRPDAGQRQSPMCYLYMRFWIRKERDDFMVVMMGLSFNPLPKIESLGCIPFTCSRTVYCVLEHCSGMLERNISAQFYCSVLNEVFLEHCSFTLKYDSSFRHLESHGNSVCRCTTPPFIIRPSKIGRIMGSPVTGGWAASSSLSGAYLQNYST